MEATLIDKGLLAMIKAINHGPNRDVLIKFVEFLYEEEEELTQEEWMAIREGGSVLQKAIGGAVRLVDTLNGMQVWGDQYQRQLRPDKLIALQEEIAQEVAGKIGSEYGIIPRNLSKESRKKPPESLDTYETFLWFYHHVTVLTPETFEEALRVLE